MEKRLVLAVGLSFLVIFLWSRLLPQKQLTQSAAIIQNSSQENVADVAPSTASMPLLEQTEVSQLSEYVFHTPLMKIVFSEPSGAVKTISFKKYQNYEFNLEKGLLFNKVLNFSRESDSSATVKYVYKDDDKKITKAFNFSNDSYYIELQINVVNVSNKDITIDLPIILGQLDFNAKNSDNQQGSVKDVTVSTQENLIYPNAKKEGYFNNLKFIGLRERYFCAIIQPTGPGFSGFINQSGANKSIIGISTNNLNIKAGQEITKNFKIYLGPQDSNMIKPLNPDWLSIIYFGKLDLIANVLLGLLKFFNGVVHNWGLAIVLFSLTIYLILFPLSVKQFRSMKQMQEIQPKLEELRQKYKDDVQKFNREQLALFKEHKINPLGGCLPLILQIPVFITLYQVLTRTVALKGAGFLWIKDLTMPDRLFILPFSMPLLGNEINILPAFMTIGMYIQQKFTTVPQSGSSAEQQKLMMIMMPVVMLFAFYRLPSGVNLYWAINSVLMLIFQLKLMKSK
jgi:YidC/Oxa1 family membrane protein insertase